MKLFRGFLLVALLCATATVSAQTYIMTMATVSGSAGGTADAAVTFDNNGVNLSSWTMGMCNDPALATVTDVVQGAYVGSLPSPFDTGLLFADGWTRATVVDLLLNLTLAPGVGYEFHIASYDIAAGATGLIDLTFCGTLGSPPVPVEVVDASGINTFVPDVINGGIDLGGLPGGFELSAGSALVAQGGIANVAVTLENSEAVDGFSFGLQHDPAIVTLSSIDPSAAVAATNGGAGPAFFTANVLANGGTVGCVISLMTPFDEIAIGTTDIADYAYNVIGTTGQISALDFVDTLGTPPVQTVVDVNGISQIPGLTSGSVEVDMGAPMVVFNRGDANQDGGINISDAIFTALWLFAQGPVVLCEDAADADDNGSVGNSDVLFILNFLFNVPGSMPIAAPTGVCDVDPTADTLNPCVFDINAC